MARECLVCTSKRLGEVDRDLLAGETVASVARAYGISDSSVRRHYQNHLSGSILTRVSGSNVPSVSDLVQRLLALASDVEAVRAAAMLKGNGGAVLRAANAEASILRDLIGTLGVDSSSLSTYLTQADALARAIGRVGREHPELGQALAAALNESGDDELAREFSSSITTTSLPQKELHQ